MTTARDTIVDALDIESFVLCESGEPALRQSQRDCVLQPKVARHELPWVAVGMVFNLNGVASFCHGEAATPLGLFACDTVSQGSSCLATLGLAPESRWDSELEFPKTFNAQHRMSNGFTRRRCPNLLSERGSVTRSRVIGRATGCGSQSRAPQIRTLYTRRAFLGCSAFNV